MQRLLNPSEAALIDERFHDNALLQACKIVWPGRQDEIVSVMARSEDIFCESAWLMDEIIDTDEDIDVVNLAYGLWSNVVSDIGQWNNGISLADRYLIVSTIFHLVATSFSLHWHSYYCDTLRDALLTVVDEKRPSPRDLHDYQQLDRQQEELLEAIIPCSQMLNDWVNEYIDNSDFYLIEEIDMALTPPQNVKPEKPESGKADKKAFDPDTFRETFTYWPDGMKQEERDIRLKMAFNRMRGTLIDRNTHYDTFEALLSGKPLDVKIVWIGINSQLRELFSQLVTKKKLLKKPTGGLNQILTARFKKADGTLFTANEIKDAGSDGDMSAVNDVVVFLTPSPVAMEDLETQLRRIQTEELERAELRGMKDNKHQEHLPKGTNLSSKPNQHTHKNNKKS
ncbi:MAG: hypothetical protein J6T44_09160 [Prevotella sp.]|nr:hypothetical protein [Prevotella sp.]